MKEHYVTYDQAVKLKELGFEGNGLKNHIYQGYYKFPNGCISPIKQDSDGILVQFRKKDAEKIPAPRIDQAQAWLRETKGIAINIIAHDGGKWEYDIVFLPNAADGTEIANRSPWCRTYEEALTEGLDEALELLGKMKKI